jgi:hypothetical protein
VASATTRGGLFVSPPNKVDYLKYYFLEDYLFGEVKDNFQKNGYLLPEEFFCIVIWKANRAKTKIKNRLLRKNADLKKAVKSLTGEIFKASDDLTRLDVLLKEWGFQLPMASAILTILFPDRFTIYDIRVSEQLSVKAYNAKTYFSDFLPKVKDFSKKNNLNLRDADRTLWGMSFYEDLQKLVK